MKLGVELGRGLVFAGGSVGREEVGFSEISGDGLGKEGRRGVVREGEGEEVEGIAETRLLISGEEPFSGRALRPLKSR